LLSYINIIIAFAAYGFSKNKNKHLRYNNCSQIQNLKYFPWRTIN